MLTSEQLSCCIKFTKKSFFLSWLIKKRVNLSCAQSFVVVSVSVHIFLVLCCGIKNQSLHWCGLETLIYGDLRLYWNQVVPQRSKDLFLQHFLNLLIYIERSFSFPFHSLGTIHFMDIANIYRRYQKGERCGNRLHSNKAKEGDCLCQNIKI